MTCRLMCGKPLSFATDTHESIFTIRAQGLADTVFPLTLGFLVGAAPEHTNLIRTARLVNNNKQEHIVAKVKREATRFKRPVIACLGLSYKANIDDPPRKSCPLYY